MLKFHAASLNKVVPTVAALDAVIPFRKSILAPAKAYSPMLKFNIDNFDNNLILQSVRDAMIKFGNWNYRIGETKSGDIKVDNGYGGIGLTYNPNHVDGVEIDIHQQVQGNHKPGAQGLDGKNPFTMLSVDEKRQHSRKNTHYDTYGMCYRTPASRSGALGTFLDSFKRTMVRSAVRVIYADQIGQVGDEQLAGVRWHRDEPFFENLRVNIPLLTSPLFVLEQEGQEPVNLEAGYAYTWDTNTLHRAYATARPQVPQQRIHLMLGFSCWWDFDEESSTWSQNEFFNKKHPLDMLVDGDVIPGLRLT
jgi:hypothetical protein